MIHSAEVASGHHAENHKSCDVIAVFWNRGKSHLCHQSRYYFDAASSLDVQTSMGFFEEFLLPVVVSRESSDLVFDSRIRCRCSSSDQRRGIEAGECDCRLQLLQDAIVACSSFKSLPDMLFERFGRFSSISSWRPNLRILYFNR